MVIFNSYVSHYQRVKKKYVVHFLLIHIPIWPYG